MQDKMDHKFLRVLFPVQSSDSIQLNRKEFSNLERFAVEHNVKQLVYCQIQNHLKKFGDDEEKSEFLREHRRFFFSSAAYSVKYQVFQDNILALLQKNDIPAITLKGTAITRQVYHNPNARISCDIDILIKESDVERAHALFCQEKFRWEDSVPLPFLRLRLHHTTYFSPENTRNIPIEVHWNFSIPGFFNLTSEEIWEQTECDAKNEYSLKPDMALILLLMHHHRHAFKELRNLVDVLWAFYRFENDIDWKSFAWNIKKIGLLKTTFLTIRQIEALWPEESNNLKRLQEFKKEIHKQQSPSLLLSYLTHHIHIEKGEFNFKDKCIYRLALDHWFVLVLSFIKSIFPAPNVINELFGNQRKSHLFNNYLHFIKWRFFGHKIP